MNLGAETPTAAETETSLRPWEARHLHRIDPSSGGTPEEEAGSRPMAPADIHRIRATQRKEADGAEVGAPAAAMVADRTRIEDGRLSLYIVPICVHYHFFL